MDEDLKSSRDELQAINADLRAQNRQLRRANSDLETLLESADMAVLVLDRAFRVRTFTPAAAALCGLETGDVGRPIFDLPARIDHSDLRADAEAAGATRRPVDREVRLDGTGEMVLMRIKSHRTAEGGQDGYVISFLDIPPRARTETVPERSYPDLDRHYAELEALYDTAPVGLSLMDRDLKWTRINQRLADINGIPIKAHIGKTFHQLLPDLAEDLDATYREILRTGEPSLENSIETTFPNAPETVRNFSADFYPIHLDGEVQAVAACVTEVTEQKRLLGELSESERRMKRIFDAAPMFIAIFEGPDHVCGYANPATRRAVGNRALKGLPVREALPALRDQGIFQCFDAAYRTGTRQVVPEFRFAFDRNGDGRTLEGWFSQVLEPVRDGAGEVIGVISFAYEITDQVEARRAAQESAATKTFLLAELQHRVKNTLATVRAISRFLVPGAATATAFHDRLSARLGAMSRTHDLLTDANWMATNLADIVAAEATSYERGRDRRVIVRGEAIPLTSKQALAFGMAVHELMINAAKYGALAGDDGHIEIDLAARRSDAPARMVWREIGGPPVGGAPDRKGFGSVVIERVLVSDVNADISICYEPGGLRFEATF
ncbi:MAG: PAS domain-containing protein [Pseudomonadota bacterium]